METILTSIAAQWPMAVLIFVVVVWMITHEDKKDKCEEESREKERNFHMAEAEKQRVWNEEQGKKRDEFQRELTEQTHKFIETLQKDQAKSIDLLNESIRLVASKTDLVLDRVNHHHAFTEKSVTEIDKWVNGTAVTKRRVKKVAE
jgi:hypothetical protein